MVMRIWTGIILLFSGLTLSTQAAATEEGTLVRLQQGPDGALQPEVVVDAQGTLHSLYFVGEPAAGDLMYRRRGAGDDDWTPPVRVNSTTGSVIAIGTVRGGHLALGAGRVHVAWMSADRDNPGMFYTHSDDEGGFAPQRNVTSSESALDGGGSVAADEAGHVYVAWHAGHDGEPKRRLFVAASSDTGRSFRAEERANPIEAGACGCCGMRAGASPDGPLWILYRAATESVHRDMQLLASTDGGRTFSQRTMHPWELAACPMSTAAISPSAGGALLAWETDGQIFWSQVTAAGDSSQVHAVAGEGSRRKHPAVAVDADGRIAIVWTEGTGWNRGGDLAWQVVDAHGGPLESGRMEAAVGTWSRAAVVAHPDGGFFVLH
jgi:hypothetical protein